MSAAAKDLNKEYEAVPFSLREYVSMRELFRSAFNLTFSYDAFVKRFDTTALGCEVIGFIAKHRKTNTPAAYYGVFPAKLLIDGEVILAAQSGDTMTHEKHRKKGLFIWLAEMTLEKCREKNMAFVFGQPNKNSLPGLVHRLHFEPLDKINAYDLKLRIKTFPLPKLSLKAGLFPFYLRFARIFLSGYRVKAMDAFHNTYSTGYGKVARDRNYLDYKSDSNKFFLRIGEVIVWVSLTDVFWIGEVSDYSAVNAQVLNRLKKMAVFLGYNTIRFNFNESLPLPPFLLQFKRTGQELSCFYYLNEKYRTCNLVLTAADFDTW